METLSNVETRRGEAIPPCVRFIPDTIPDTKSSKTGASVRYVHDLNKKWYVFRASYGREDKAADFMIEDGCFVYIAKRCANKMVKGKVKRVYETFIPNLLFVYTTEMKAEEYIKKTPALSYLSYYYNHFEINAEQKNPPLTISCREMENFICATCGKSEHLLFLKEDQCRFKRGETVKIIDGPFKGVEGKVARVAGQQRVVISLSQIGLISTAYIPTAFVQPI